ncbi:MAG: DUF393 domain-containing protein [Candidatus Berkiellales bacterium]
MSKIKVYYNSACPVCNAGIAKQKLKTTECSVQWIDIHSNIASRKDIAKDIETLRKQIHLIDDNQQLKVGIAAFEVLWRHSPKDQWKAKIIALPVIKQLALMGYFIFSQLLYQWNRLKGHW